MIRRALALGVAAAALSCASGAGSGSAATSPELRAVAFLAREVPDWPVKNKCYSCHNNGDAARALFEARRRSIAFDPGSLESTTRWLLRPEAWEDNGPKKEFTDKRLAALQFAHALAEAIDPGGSVAEDALVRAAGQVRDLQGPDGSWEVDAGGLPGSPVTYGRMLATVAARRVLVRAGKSRFAEAIGKADAWLRLQRPSGVLDSAAALLGWETIEGPEVAGQRRERLDVLRKGQGRDGGWGPYITSPPEAFDTAIALLGLATVRGEPGVPEMTRRGREFLLSIQESDGSWPPTTRPPGADSYAQRISTTAWSTLALLRTP